MRHHFDLLSSGRRAPFRKGVALAAAALALAAPVAARAEPSDADRATARALAGEGNAAAKRNDYETAEDRFRRADALVHAPTLVVEHARALVALGRLADAYARYELVVREGVKPDAPWTWKRAVQDATRELDELRPKVSWLVITVKGPSSPRVEIDGRPVPNEELGVRRPADPGERRVTVSAPGFVPKEGKLSLLPGADAVLDVELVPDPAAKPEPAPAPVAVVTEAEPAREPREAAPDRTLAYVALGIGGVGLATGAVTGVLALSARSDIAAACPDLHCRPETAEEARGFQEDADRYHLYGTISGVGFAVGVAGAATGIALLLLQSDSEKQESGAAVAPVIGPRSLGVRGTF